METILKNIETDKGIMKALKGMHNTDVEYFINQAERYIDAIKQGRMICSIASVSKSGMSRNIKFLECKKYKDEERYTYLNFFMLFKALGFSEARNKNHYFSIGGCGMDMIFHTNYTIINKLHRLGFMSDDECRSLAQMTPEVI